MSRIRLMLLTLVLASLAASPAWSARVTDGLLALYEFDEGSGSTVSDTSGAGTPLDLIINTTTAVTWQTGRLQVNTTTVIASPGSADKIIQACRLSNSLTVEAWVNFTDLSLDGPARIVTLSADAIERNFTLGQQFDDYVFRLRTTTTDLNGRPNLVPAAGVETGLRHIVFTRESDGDTVFYLDGAPGDNFTRDGDFSNWAAGHRFALANEINGGRDWVGTYHLVAVYDRALTSPEVAQNYAAGADPATPTPSRTPSSTATGSPTVSPTFSSTPSATPTSTPSPTGSPTATVSRA